MSLPAVEVPARLSARVAGEGALAFLHDTTTQDLASLEPGQGALTCYLDDKGRLLAELRVVVVPDGSVLLDAEPASASGLEQLTRIAPLAGVAIEQLALVLTPVRGPVALDAFAPLPEVEHGSVEHDGVVVIRTVWGGEGYDLLAPSAIDVERGLDAEVMRIAEGRPRFGVDIAPGTLVNETPLLARAVAMTKGCYPGQESVARVHNLGSVRRRFVLVAFDGSLPTLPVPVAIDGEEAGTMTSAAEGVGIASVRASVEPGQALSVGGARGTVARAL